MHLNSSRRHFLFSSVAAGVLLAGQSVHARMAKAGGGSDGGEILGQGSLRFSADRFWGKIDHERVPVGDCHGVVEDSAGHIVMLTNTTRNNLVVYNKRGQLVGTRETRFPGAHGLDITRREGQDLFWITDHERQTLTVSTADGEDVLHVGPERLASHYSDLTKYHPTNSACLADGSFFIGDGYGSSFVHRFDPEGRYIASFGGVGDAPEKLLTPHSVWIDRRSGAERLLVCDRGHDTLKWFTPEGELLEAVKAPRLSPSNVAPMKGAYADHIVVAGLNGALAILDGTNRVVSILGGGAPEYDGGELQPVDIFNYTFQHPHDVYVDDDNAIYVVQWWSRGTYPVKLSLIR